jgi:WD40 repeat protein
VEYLAARNVLRNAGPPPGEPDTKEARRWEIAHDVLAKAALRWRDAYLRQRAVREAEQRAWRRAKQWSVRVGVGLLLLGTALWTLLQVQATAAEERREIRESEQRQGLSNTLAALARFHLPLDPGLAAALAATADSISPGMEPLGVLHRALFEPFLEDAYSTGNHPVVSLEVASPDRFFVATLDGRLMYVDSSGPKVPLDTVKGPVDAAILLPGGRSAVVASGRPVSYLRRILFDRRTKQELAGHTERVYAMALAANKRSIFSVDEDGSVLLHADTSGPTLQIWNQSEAAVSVATNDFGLIAVGADGGLLRVARPPSNPRYGARHSRWISSVTFDDSGTRLLTASHDTTARLWRVDLGSDSIPTAVRLLRTFRGHKGVVYGAEFSPDNRRVVTASRDGTARIWDVETGYLLGIMRHPTGVRVARFISAERIVTAAEDGLVRVWRWRNRTPAAVAETSEPDSAGVIARGGGTEIIIRRNLPHVRRAGTTSYAVLTKASAAADAESARRVVDAAVSRNGQYIAIVEGDSTVSLWDARTARVMWTYHSTSDVPVGVAFTPDDYVVSASDAGVGIVWNISGTAITQVRADYDLSRVVPGGRWLLVPLPGQVQVYACDVCASRAEVRQRFGSQIRSLTDVERHLYLGKDASARMDQQ